MTDAAQGHDDSTEVRQYVTRVEYAGMRGKSRQAVAWQIRRERIREVEVDGQPMIDWREADDATGWGAGKPRIDGLPPIDESARRKEHWIAQIRELEYRQRAGELCRKVDQETAGFTLGRQVRDRLEHVGSRIGYEVAALAPGLDPNRVIAIIEREHRSALETICDEAGRRR